MRRVLVTSNPAAAHIAVASLENADIEAVVQGEHMAGLPAGPNALPSVWVRDEDFEQAIAILGVSTPDSPASVAPKRPSSPLKILAVILLAVATVICFQLL